ncbi:ATP-binding protein [Nocardiopsis sp. NRRL B-16309]|uniref:ATP-binding protein n=1 Tax=Nocardiopsis sp. NRRL B-16309 TaxID=1519494 RepID=UPI0006AF8089|nr:ATP-binding protein [Nocardiopsis sp. NRRL B-16309]
MHARLTLVALPNVVAIARAFTTATLRGLPYEAIDNAELLVSELGTNVVQAAGLAMTTPISAISHRHVFALSLNITGNRLVIEVHDLHEGHPTPQPQNEDAESGRGLFLVEALSQRWGVSSHPQGGKVVWCVIALEWPVPAERLAAEAPATSAPAYVHRQPLPRRSAPHDVPPVPPSTPPLAPEDMERVVEGLARL